MLLSVDWDALSGTRELVFDAPIWGTRDRPEDRLEAWHERRRRRGGPQQNPGGAQDWSALEADFPLYPGAQALRGYAGVPTWAALSHAEAWGWLDRFGVQDVLNIDSHHDLYSGSGDPTRVRPGNWAGLALAAGKVRHYTCQYPAWHAGLPVAEGHDLERTAAEVAAHLPPDLVRRVTLRRGDVWPEPAQVTALLLVQSPAWTSPAHDPAFWSLVRSLGATLLDRPLDRR